jgi:UDP-N-acetyl-D-galactosamine dehydrogenase
MKTKFKICIVGLGYVGLPLAVHLGRVFDVVGFDINEKKISELKSGFDSMKEVSKEELDSTKIKYTADPSEIRNCDFIIVAVPTPVDNHNLPDFTPLIKSSETISKNLSSGSIVVYESTVYPGAVEEVCVPVLEKFSKLKCGKDFKVGYSPERINPGDKEHTISKVVKVVSGMDDETLDVVASVYGKITNVFKAKSIKTAEAAKVIENIQRDLNIALMNELSLIFERIGINVKDVVAAASTKWNFHKYTPGLVGGHCIGVDPYYLTYKAQELGYQPHVILAGREINESMAKHVAELTVKGLNKLGKVIQGSKVLILGLTFKENVKDARNSKTLDVIRELKEFGVDVVACDPYLTQEEVDHEGFGVKNLPFDKIGKVDAIILTVPHKEFVKNPISYYGNFFKDKKLFFDIKSFYDKDDALSNGFVYLSL